VLPISLETKLACLEALDAAQKVVSYTPKRSVVNQVKQ